MSGATDAPGPDAVGPDAPGPDVTATGTTDLPGSLAGIRDDFLALGLKDRLQLLLEFSDELPDLPPRYAEHPDLLERVEECQSPVHLFVEVEGGDGGGDAGSVHLYVTAPRESPTTRGFASILAQGLDGLSPRQVLDAVPDDYPQTLGLTEAVSPLRIRGMSGMLGRIKRQVRERHRDAV